MSRYVGVGKTVEVTYGTEPGGQDYQLVKVTSVTDPTDRAPLLEETIDSYITNAAYGGPLKISGTIEGSLRPKSLQYLWAALFGAPTTSGNFSFYSAATPQSLNMVVAEDSLILRHAGVGIKTAGVELNAKEIATCKFDWFASSTVELAADPTTSAYISEDPIVFYNADMIVDGSATIKIKSFSIDIDRKLDEDYFIVGDFRIQGARIGGNTEITGRITFSETQYAELRRAMFGSSVGTCLTSLNTLGTAAITINCTAMDGTTSVIQFQMPAATIYAKGERTIKGKDLVDKLIDYRVIGDDFRLKIKTT